jgi:type IV secretory pathway component VirB8
MRFWKRGNKDTIQKNDGVVSEQADAVTWESSRIDNALKSERLAWKVAGSSVALSGLLVVAIVTMMPLKESVPYVIRVDSVGGADIITTLKDRPVGYEEVMDKYWLSKYVKAYESWEYYTAQSDYDFVGLTSSPSVAKHYSLLFTGPQSIEKQYGEKNIVKTQILSVTPAGNGIASVRFEKKIVARNAPTPDAVAPVTKWVATIGYEYKKISKMKEKERLVNPLGFQVTSYRVDAEMISASPPELPAVEQKSPIVPAIDGSQRTQK